VALAAAVTSCAAATRAQPAASADVDLAIVTWNMHIGVGDLPRLVADLAAGRLTGVVPRQYVLLLEEVTDGGPNDPAPIARERNLSLQFQPIRQRSAHLSGNAILSTLPLSNVRQITLPREREPRGSLLATTTLADQIIFLVAVHLENRVSLQRGLLFSDGPRARQARALIANLPAGHGIAGGDLNTWLGPDEPALKIFAARFPNTPTDRLQPTVVDRLVLDHLFFDVPAGWQVRRWSLRDYYGSDHRPVVGVVSTRK
jgi:endonuclease/exonuclease/phosphatase family metal-dependent hydrolase